MRMDKSLQDQAIDIVLTDYCMPEMTGYDLLKAIKVERWRACETSSKILFSVSVFVSSNVNLSIWISESTQALGSPNPIPVVVMSSENEPQRISRWSSWHPFFLLFFAKPSSINSFAKLKILFLFLYIDESCFCNCGFSPKAKICTAFQIQKSDLCVCASPLTLTCMSSFG